MNPMTDKFDLLILAELQQDARLPTPELAHRVGLSAPACYRRVRALRESGLIEREVALVAPSTMGWPITMLVLVTLERDHGRIVDEMIASLQREPEVMDLWYVTGSRTSCCKWPPGTCKVTSSSPVGCSMPGTRCAVSRLWWSWDSTSVAAPCCPGKEGLRRSLAGIAGAPSGERNRGRYGLPLLCQPGSPGASSSAVMGRKTRQGLPTATTPAGMSLVTTDPAPMTLLSPMVTPGQMTTLPPIQTLLPMRTGLPNSTP